MRRHVLLEELHLVGKDPPVGQDQVFRLVRHVRGVQQLDAGFLGHAVALVAIALPAGGHHVHPGVAAAARQRADVVARKAASVLAGFEACGCKLNNPNMQLSLLALVVIPELRISDKGLVDVTKFDFVPVLQSLPAGPELSSSLPRRKPSKSPRGRVNEASKKV